MDKVRTKHIKDVDNIKCTCPISIADTHVGYIAVVRVKILAHFEFSTLQLTAMLVSLNDNPRQTAVDEERKLRTTTTSHIFFLVF